MKQRYFVGVALAALMLFFGSVETRGQSAGPTTGTFHLLSDTENGELGPPLPFNPYPNLPITAVGPENYVINDLAVAAAKATLAEMSMTTMDASGPPAPGDGGGSTNTDFGGPYNPQAFPPGVLWIELTNLDTVNGLAYLTLHNTANGNYYYLISSTNVAMPQSQWTREQFRQADNTGKIDFDPVAVDVNANPTMFFRGKEWTHPTISVHVVYNPAIEPYPTRDGIINFNLDLPSPVDFTVYYQITGSASNGVTYSLLSGLVVIPASQDLAVIPIHPLPDDSILTNSQMTLTLIPTNTYDIDPAFPSGTVDIVDNPFHAVVTNLMQYAYGGDFFDYSPPQKSFIMAVNWPDGAGSNFVRIDTNAVFHPWSSISDIPKQVNFAVVKTNYGGFTMGDMYFANGSPGGIGWLSADGSTHINNWLTLPGEANYLRGGFYFDQTGIYGGDLIVVTGDADAFDQGAIPFDSTLSVWRVRPNATATLVTNITSVDLEGALTLSNNSTQYGPWAGKILTGDEWNQNMYVLQGSTSTTPYNWGIAGQDFHVIPPNQDFYVLKPYGDNQDFRDFLNGVLFKVSSNYFTGHVGDIMITQESPGALFLVHWNNASNTFTTNIVAYPDGALLHGVDLENGTFAPITLPLSNPQ